MVVMGRVIAAYGVHGWIKVRAFTSSPDALIAYRDWWLAKDDGAWREFHVNAANGHAGAVVAGLEGLEAREDAALWRGAWVGIPRSALPALDRGEVYLEDLVGLEVVNREGKGLGRVAGLVQTAAHPVLRVDDGGRSERLIPLVDAYVEAIDVDAGRIVVDWRTDY
jgi:16S rRNA processing protein RimM